MDSIGEGGCDPNTQHGNTLLGHSANFGRWWHLSCPHPWRLVNWFSYDLWAPCGLAMVWMPGASRPIRPRWHQWRSWHWALSLLNPWSSEGNGDGVGWPIDLIIYGHVPGHIVMLVVLLFVVFSLCQASTTKATTNTPSVTVVCSSM